MDTTIKRHVATEKPANILVYGSEGIGKTTFAASAPKPIFIQTEDGLGLIEADTFGICQSWQDVGQALGAILNDPQGHQTLVIDSADWLQTRIWQDLCARYGKKNIEEFRFGSGYNIARDEYWDKLLLTLDAIRARHHMTIILVAHDSIMNITNPTGDDFCKFVPRLDKRASARITEWADATLYAHRKMKTDRETGKARAFGIEPGGDRVLACVGSPAVTAKNRYHMPEELPLSWDAVAQYLPGLPKTCDASADHPIEPGDAGNTENKNNNQ